MTQAPRKTSDNASRVYHFGGFRLNAAARELWRDEAEITLPPKAFACLLYLVEHRERAISREELLEAVWKHAHLTDSTLDQTIFLIRRALGDTAETQRHVKTVRGFGYHWVAPTETDDQPPSTRVTPYPTWRALALAGVLAVGAMLFLWLVPDWHEQVEISKSTPISVLDEEADLVLVLPVVVEDTSGHDWIRLGVMELIAERLRAAGQAVVPGETVIVLMDRWSPTLPEDDAPDQLASATGARLLIESRAERGNGQWRVSLQGRSPEAVSATAVGEADGVLEAARIAADRFALSLGRTPAPEPDAEPGLDMLVQQLRAAILAGQREVARELVERTTPALRTHPEVRYQLARLDLYSRDIDRMDNAEQILESLLTSPSIQEDAVFQSRILVALGGVHHSRGDDDAAKQMLLKAADLMGSEQRPDRMCDIWNNLGLLAIRQDDFDQAREHLVQGRVACETVGNREGVAHSDHHLGGIELLNTRYIEAVFHFEQAIDNFSAMHYIDGELWAQTSLIIARLEQLDLPEAALIEGRMRELRDQATAPALQVYADLFRAQYFILSGQWTTARQLIDRMLDDAEETDTHRQSGISALQVELATQLGDHTQAAQEAIIVLEAVRQGVPLNERMHGRIWLAAIRGHLTSGDINTASDALAAMADWSEQSILPAAEVYQALAEAKFAVASNRERDASQAFERALSLARSHRLPRQLLEVAERYVEWLLTSNLPDADSRALVVASHASGYADRYYDAALVQLRVAHATGATATWRSALERTRTLAGERAIPESLLSPP